MKRGILIVILVIFNSNGFSQVNLQWYFNNTGATNGFVRQMLKFPNKDLLVWGYNGMGDIDPGPGVNNSGSSDFFARYNEFGNLVFGRPLCYNSNYSNGSIWVEIDNGGNFFFSFRGSGTFDFDTIPGSGELIMTTGDVALVKFDEMGNFKWGFVYGSYVTIYSISALSDNSVIIAGTYDYGMHDLDPGPAVYNVTSSIQYEGYIAKFDSSGNFITARQFQGATTGFNSTFYLTRMDQDTDDNIYLGGSLEGSFDVDPGPGTYVLTGSSNINDEQFLMKLNNNLDLEFAYKFSEKIFFRIFTDKSNSVYLCGMYTDSVDMDPGPGVSIISSPVNHDCFFLAKFDPIGSFVWVKTIMTNIPLSGLLTTTPYVDDEGMLNFDMYLNAGLVTNSVGLPQLPNNGFITPGHYMVQLDTSGTAVFAIRFPDVQNSMTFVIDPSHFYYASRIYDPVDIQIGPGITTSAPAGIGNEFCLSYYSMDPSLSRISGNVFLDLNYNNIRDLNENGIKNIITEISPGNYFLSTDNLGNFGAYVSTGYHTMAVPSLPVYLTGPVPLMHTANFTAANQVDSINNFAVAFDTSARDMAVYLTPNGQARPGMNFNYNITYTNNGYAPQSGLIEVLLDSSVSFVSATVAPTVVNGNLCQWQYNILNPIQSANIYLQVHVDSAAQVSDTIVSTVSITPLAGDDFPLSNFDTARIVITGSYDPNSKEVMPSGVLTDEQTSAGIELTYTLNFQNTGNDTAFNVIILDTLSGFLDIGSLKVIASSHLCNFALYSGNLMEYRFANILLPDSNVNELLSHGFVKYKIKTKTNLIPGDIIKNTAYNYFDFNIPVATNTVQTPIVDFVGLKDYENHFYAAVYPNPFSKIFYVKFENPSYKPVRLNLKDLSGRVIRELVTTSEEAVFVDVDELSIGVYILEVHTFSGIKNFKLIKFQK